MPIRERLYVDSNVQGVLVGRIAIYWIGCILYACLGATCTQYYQLPDASLSEHAEKLFTQFWPWIPSAVLMLPLIMYDMVRLSNRFVGPVFRVRRQLDDLVQDSQCDPLSFRTDDYWRNLVGPMNALQSRIQELEREVTELRSSPEDQHNFLAATQQQSNSSPGMAKTQSSIPLASIPMPDSQPTAAPQP